MSPAQRTTETQRGSTTRQIAAPRCVIKCVRKCVIQLHTSTAARPRQHWVFTRSPSPTTRPPRGNLEGWVRVVGLGLISVQMQTGAGGLRLLDQAMVGVEPRGNRGEEKT
jgi:hypothetical protein